MKRCDCGCGQPAAIATNQAPKRGYIRGQPCRYALGHSSRWNRSQESLERELRLAIYARGDCYEWRGRRDRNGYGRFKMYWVHRFVYQIAKGPIPSGLEIDHICRHRWCVRPSHLEAVLQRVNAFRARRSHCKRGHALTSQNSYLRPDKKGRQCYECIRLRSHGDHHATSEAE